MNALRILGRIFLALLMLPAIGYACLAVLGVVLAFKEAKDSMFISESLGRFVGSLLVLIFLVFLFKLLRRRNIES